MPWGRVMRDSIGAHRIGAGSPCVTGGTMGQNYFMGALADIKGTPRTLDTMSDWFAERRIQNQTKYAVIGPGGTVYPSREGVCLFPRNHDSADDLPYFVQRHAGTGGARDTGYAKPAFTRVDFDTALLRTTGKVVTSVRIEARARKYSPTDCSSTSAPTLPPYADSAFVRITFHVSDRTAGLPYTERDEHIWKKFATADIDQDNVDLWNYFDAGTQWQTDSWCSFNVDLQGYLVFTADSADAYHNCTAPGTYRIMRILDSAMPASACEFVCFPASRFEVNGMTGEMLCRYNAAGLDSTEAIPCLDFCTVLSGYRTMTKVIAAAAQRFDNVWPYDTSEFLRPKALDTWSESNTSNTIYETAQAFWRPAEAYAYRTPTKPGGKLASASERVYNNAGIFADDTGGTANAFRLFDWRTPAMNAGTRWLSAGVVTLFSPFGQPLEERDILGLYSAARFAHENTVPKLVARNARYNAVGFESFEDGRGTIDTTAHTGRWCYRLPASYASTGVFKIVIGDQARSKGMLLRLWVRRTYHSYSDADIPIAIDSAFGTGTFVKVAQTGAWALYERVCNVSAIGAGVVADLKLKDNLPSDTVWVDDVRAQPFDAEMICYVYDPATLRPVATLDDQHFAALFQYSSEGKLVRKLRETERGIKTVAETQYHVPDMFDRAGDSASATVFGGPSGFARTAMSGAGARDRAPAATPTRIDLLDANLGPGGLDWQLLGGRSVDLSRLNADSLRAALGVDTSAFSEDRLDRLKGAGFESAARVRDVMEARRLEARMAEIVERGRGDLTDEQRRALSDELSILAERRRQLMREHLGVDEQGLRELYRSLDAAEEKGR